uniref:Arm DNA-binding domain-containing protein n=1 Tax=Candidatus Cryptobacteroides bacterium TaxID=3085639 RepID=UPI004027A3E0
MSNKDISLVKEPVRIQTKELKNGNRSIYLDMYVNGERKYRFLNIYQRPCKTVGNGWLCNTCSDTGTKFAQISEISNRLNLGLKVELV